jgi:hypothetical protein
MWANGPRQGRQARRRCLTPWPLVVWCWARPPPEHRAPQSARARPAAFDCCSTIKKLRHQMMAGCRVLNSFEFFEFHSSRSSNATTSTLPPPHDPAHRHPLRAASARVLTVPYMVARHCWRGADPLPLHKPRRAATQAARRARLRSTRPPRRSCSRPGRVLWQERTAGL